MNAGRATRLLVDTSPDLRQQLLSVGAPDLDGVAFTHIHADQTHGIDDVRAVVYRRRALIPAFASPDTADELTLRFAYIFETPPNSSYPPLLQLSRLDSEASAVCDGPGGPIQFELFDVQHGSTPCSGVRSGPLVYTPDVNGLDAQAKQVVRKAGLWIVDALREKPHPSHAHLDQTLGWIDEAEPQAAILTNLHVDLDYAALSAKLPAGVSAAYDGLAVTISERSGERLG